MKIIGNLLWWLFGGIESAMCYFSGSLAMALTIVGIPFAIQTFKLGLLCLWPFGSRVTQGNSPTGCLRVPLNIIWFIFGGIWAWLLRRAALYHHHRHTFCQAALQDGRTCSHSVR